VDVEEALADAVGDEADAEVRVAAAEVDDRG